MPSKKNRSGNAIHGRAFKSRHTPGLDALEDRLLLSRDFQPFGTDESVVTGISATLDVARYATTPSGHVDSATIDWGDGSPVTTGTLDPLGDVSFLGSIGEVTGTHTYAKAGPYSVKTTLVEHNTAGDTSQSVTETITAVPASITATSTPTVLAAKGQALAGQVVAFVQTNVPDAAKSLKVTIDWGDGSTPSSGMLQPEFTQLPSGYGDDSLVTTVLQSVDDFLGSHRPDREGSAYAVLGDHTYLTPGSFTAKVTIDDSVGDTAVANTPVTVAAGTLLARSPGSLDDIAGSAVSGPLARVVDLATGAKSDPSQLSATIDWGDGSTPTAGEVHGLPDFLASTADHPSYSVSGHHTYASAGDETVTITVSDTDGRSAVTTTTVHVKAEALTLTSTPVSAASGIGGLFQVASGTDAPLVQGNHLSATIDWGDGSTPTTGHVLPTGWGLLMPGSTASGTLAFTVVGEHVYANAGSFKVHVTVTSDAGTTAATDGTATVESFSTRGIPKFAQVGTALTNEPIAAIDSASGTAAASDFTATIDWGDGSPVDSGTIVAKTLPPVPWIEDFVASRNIFLVDGTHTFAAAGTFHAKVTISDTKTGEMATVTSDILVAAAGAPVIGDPGMPTGPPTIGSSPLPINVIILPPPTASPGGVSGGPVVVVPIAGTIGAPTNPGGAINTLPTPSTTHSGATTPKKFSKPSTHHPKIVVKARARHPHGPLG